MTSRCPGPAVALLVLAACSGGSRRPALAPTDEETRALAGARAAFEAALREGDARVLAGLFTEEALLMNPRQPDVRGRVSIEASFRSAFEWVSVQEVNFTPVETEVLGARAYQRTVFTERVVWRKGGKPPAFDEGRALFVRLLEADGQWRVHRVLVNTTLADSPLH